MLPRSVPARSRDKLLSVGLTVSSEGTLHALSPLLKTGLNLKNNFHGGFVTMNPLQRSKVSFTWGKGMDNDNGLSHKGKSYPSVEFEICP